MKTAAVLVAVLACVLASVDASPRRLNQAAPGPCASGLPIPQTAENAGLTTLLEAVEAAGLTETVSDPSLAVTIFAPTNDAFSAALEMLNDTSIDALQEMGLLGPILQYHIVPMPLTGAQLTSSAGQPLETLLGAGQTLTISAQDGAYYVNSLGGEPAEIALADQPACNTIVHVIDGVLVPDLAALMMSASAPMPSAEAPAAEAPAAGSA